MERNHFLSLLDENKVNEHLLYFSGYEKLTGEAEALKSVDYITDHLKERGIRYHTYRFPAYLSNPVSSCLRAAGETILSRPRSFSADCCELQADLFYDPWSKEAGDVSLAHMQHLEQARGRLVLGWGYDERYAKLLERCGAAGWIQIWKSDEDDVHEDTVCPVWGTPDMDTMFYGLKIPVACIRRRDGEALIEKLAQGAVPAELSVHCETAVKEAVLPVAEIPGRRKEFVLLGGHYDTWYIGAYDNGSSNAAMLEVASALQQMQDTLEYSVRICWWPGHSNGRYMGSTWYCDHFFEELDEYGIACVNSDMIGAAGMDIAAIRTTGAEGDAFVSELLQLAVPGAEHMNGPIGRGADQSFFGTNIPYHINPRFEAKVKQYATPGAGGDYWHTKADTYDKLSRDMMEKDTRLLGLIVYGLASAKRLPLQVDDYFDLWEGRLKKVMEEADPSCSLAEILELMELLRGKLKEAESRQEDESIRIRRIKEVFGNMNRLFQSGGSRYEQDTSFAYGSFHLLAESARGRREDMPEDIRLFHATTFIRQKNRMLRELRRLLKEI